jgi:hypothetical protein
MKMARTLGMGSILVLVFAVLLTTLFYMTVPPPTIPQVNLTEEVAFPNAVFATVKLPVGQPYTDHAQLKHPASYLRAEECAVRPDITLYNSQTNRFVDICKTSAGLFGTFIYQIENGLKREVTALEKEKMKYLEQVLKWLKNCKYSPELPPGIPIN